MKTPPGSNSPSISADTSKVLSVHPITHQGLKPMSTFEQAFADYCDGKSTLAELKKRYTAHKATGQPLKSSGLGK